MDIYYAIFRDLGDGERGVRFPDPLLQAVDSACKTQYFFRRR